MQRTARLGLTLWLATLGGCQCNDTELIFPEVGSASDSVPPTEFGQWLSMNVAPDQERLTISYYDRTLGAAGFAVGVPQDDDTVVWKHERVDGYPSSEGIDGLDRGVYGSHVVAEDGTVWYAYSDGLTAGLYVSHRKSGGNWKSPEQVELGSGAWTDIAMDANNQPVITHVGPEGESVHISRRAEGAWTTTEVYRSQATSVTTEEKDGEVVFRAAEVAHTAIVIDQDREYVALYDVAAGALILLEGTAQGFTPTTVATGDVGAWPSMEVVEGEVFIATHDVAQQTLVLAHRVNSEAFTLETVDANPLTGADSALFLPEDGSLGIVYFEGHHSDQRIARSHSDGSWSRESLSEPGHAQGFHNEVAFAGGRWWAGCFDYTDRTLVVQVIPDAEGAGR